VDPEFIKLNHTLFIFNASDQSNKRPMEIYLYLNTNAIRDIAA
jgi:hypothetical protein